MAECARILIVVSAGNSSHNQANYQDHCDRDDHGYKQAENYQDVPTFKPHHFPPQIQIALAPTL